MGRLRPVISPPARACIIVGCSAHMQDLRRSSGQKRAGTRAQPGPSGWARS
jgi:hypothetical protein